jgi:hypothetical protein
MLRLTNFAILLAQSRASMHGGFSLMALTRMSAEFAAATTQ